ncbi:TrmH family RNA methyltransferase, partial [Mesorhizobium sp. M2A.F.Ca.ET.067.02.1.1]
QKIALVLGAEGKGLRQKTRETVAALARLDMPGAIHSLNVSNAAAVSLYAARKFLANSE